MIISRTPLRISFFGGGTDYPRYFEEEKGAVLSTTIDKYIYISVRYLPPFFEHKSRIVWSLIERVKDISEIQHPSVKECIKFMKIDKGVEIHCDSDLPARTGLGSSSSFTVGLLHCLYALKGKIISKTELAKNAIYIEQELIKENVGCQDQISAAFGGLNLIEFFPGKKFCVSPIALNTNRLNELENYLMLVFTGFSRYASEIAGETIKKIPEKKTELKTMYQMVYEGIKILSSNTDLKEFGKLLHENWKLKRTLTDKTSTTLIDEIYSTAIKYGAIGGKLLGAGNGGFMLLFVPPDIQPRVKSALKNFLQVPFRFENIGTQIIFYHSETEYAI